MRRIICSAARISTRRRNDSESGLPCLMLCRGPSEVVPVDARFLLYVGPHGNSNVSSSSSSSVGSIVGYHELGVEHNEIGISGIRSFGEELGSDLLRTYIRGVWCIVWY